MSERRMLNPTPELPDDTPIDQVEFSPRVRDVLVAAGLKTVDEVRETADETLLSFQDLGTASVAHLRDTPGLQPPNLTTRREKTDIPTLLSADILALLLQPPFVHRMLWNIGGVLIVGCPLTLNASPPSTSHLRVSALPGMGTFSFPMMDGETVVPVQVTDDTLEYMASRDHTHLDEPADLFDQYRGEVEAAASAKYDKGHEPARRHGGARPARGRWPGQP